MEYCCYNSSSIISSSSTSSNSLILMQQLSPHSHSHSTIIPNPSRRRRQLLLLKPTSDLSLSASLSTHSLPPFPTPIHRYNKEGMGVVSAAWTRRSRGEVAKRPNRKSWKQRTDMYMRPFLLNVFFSKRFIHAKVMHRETSKVISVASTNAKDLRFTLPSLTDDNACRVIGNLIAQRSMEADVFAMSYQPLDNPRIEGKLRIVVDTIKETGIIFY